MTAEAFSAIAPSIPLEPGVYQYYDRNNQLLYVGKAKSLRKRISSYFTRTYTSYKTHELVQRIHRIEFTLVNNEQDAFLLENNLIKQYRPVFNINLKDDKTYPYIVIKNEPFPRIFFTRKKLNDGSVYLGPYPSVGKVRELVEFIRQHVPIRNCKLNLSPGNIQRNKFKVCLEYHLGNCKGPCEGLQSEADYAEGLERAKSILRGNLSPVIQQLRQEMQEQVEEMAFEKAALTKKKLDNLQEYRSGSTVVNERLGTVDVFSILEENDTAYVNYMAVSNGAVILSKTITLQKQLEETAAEVLAFAIGQLRTTFNSSATEIIVPFAPELLDTGLTVTVPRAGDKKKLLDLSEKNVQYFREELRKKQVLHLEEKSTDDIRQVLLAIQDALHLPALPEHIECFDNSNFQGSFPVSAMVCFRNGLPSKNDYRKFNVKTVVGANDFATMKEVVYRRYKRLQDEGQPMPQLIIIDGGKGQLGAAMESISELGLRGSVTVVGLAKNKEEIFFPGDSEPLLLPWDSDALKLIRRIRDEVHRFGITFHRQQRSRGNFRNELENIAGIGKATVDLLMKNFRSVKKIRAAGEEELAAVVGPAKASLITGFFREEPIKKEGQDENPAPF